MSPLLLTLSQKFPVKFSNQPSYKLRPGGNQAWLHFQGACGPMGRGLAQMWTLEQHVSRVLCLFSVLNESVWFLFLFLSFFFLKL